MVYVEVVRAIELERMLLQSNINSFNEAKEPETHIVQLRQTIQELMGLDREDRKAMALLRVQEEYEKDNE